MSKSWVLDVKECEDGSGDKYIELNDEILAETGWKEGDTLEWIDQGDGSFKMQKKEETTELVMVECVSTFRFPYFLGNDDYVLISGENADQLFGSQVADQYLTLFPQSDLFKPVESVSGNFIQWLNVRIGNIELAEKWFNLFDKQRKSAPIKINTSATALFKDNKSRFKQ